MSSRNPTASSSGAQRHEFPDGRAPLNSFFIRRFVFISSLFIALMAGLWCKRISSLELLLQSKSPDHPVSFLDSANLVIVDGGGFFSIITSLFALTWMGWAWFDYRTYLLCISPRVAPSDRPAIGDRKIRIHSYIHEPAGDYFTLIGIAFTFVGLALGMANISTSVIDTIASGDQDMAPTLSAAAIVFGSSLAIGLGASLLGVILAVQAREAAGIWGPLPQKSISTTSINAIPIFAQINASLISINSKIDPKYLIDTELTSSQLGLVKNLKTLASRVDRLVKLLETSQTDQISTRSDENDSKIAERVAPQSRRAVETGKSAAPSNSPTHPNTRSKKTRISRAGHQ